MNKLLAATLGLALMATPFAAAAQEGRGQGDRQRGSQAQAYSDNDYGREQSRDHARGDDRGGWSNGHSRNFRNRCYIRNETYRGRYGRIHYRQVEVCRR